MKTLKFIPMRNITLLKLFLIARKIIKVDEMIVEEEEEENKNKNLQTARVSRHSGLRLGEDRRQIHNILLPHPYLPEFSLVEKIPLKWLKTKAIIDVCVRYIEHRRGSYQSYYLPG